MLDNKNKISKNLRLLGLDADEAKVYVCLLGNSLSHLEIARQTGVNRTKVYRIADALEKRGLVTEESNDAGKVLAASHPSNLEIAITTDEERLRAKRAVFTSALPQLAALFETANTPDSTDFVVNTYEGEDGFKQMLWNELKTKGEICIFGDGSLEDLISSSRWTERHREKSLDAGFKIREILNPGSKKEQFTKHEDFQSIYRKRYIDPDILPLSQQVCIYNHTVNIYNWRHGKKVGTEIVNKAFADTQRAIFEQYWQSADA